MRKWFIGLVCLLLTALTLTAQVVIPRDYAVLSPSIRFSDDQETFTVAFTVRNTGGNAAESTTIVVRNLLNQQILSEDVLPPIANGGSSEITIPFTTREFDAGQLPIAIEVGLDDLEPLDSPLAGNNISQISVTVPVMPNARPITPTASPETSLLQTTPDGVFVGDTYIPYETVVVGAGGLLAVILFMWILSIILRRLLRRKPDFGLWQPSYAFMPMVDPNSREGRRQAWQAHAQNGLLLAAPTPNNLHVVKQLLGSDGEAFANWQVLALRLCQYDNYGRVARTQLIDSNRITKSLNRLLRRRASMTPDQIEKQIHGLVRQWIRKFRGNISAKTAFLPVALDMRFEGRHGEIRILFELYQAQNSLWVRLDQWEPAMAVSTPKIQESYSFTIHGMSSGEKLNDYLKRLTEDVTWLLSQTLQVRAPEPQQPEPQVYNVPDTLTGMQPLSA